MIAASRPTTSPSASITTHFFSISEAWPSRFFINNVSHGRAAKRDPATVLNRWPYRGYDDRLSGKGPIYRDFLGAYYNTTFLRTISYVTPQERKFIEKDRQAVAPYVRDFEQANEPEEPLMAYSSAIGLVRSLYKSDYPTNRVTLLGPAS